MPAKKDSPALTRALAAIASTFLALALVCAAGWYRAARSRAALDRLSPEQRQELVEQMLAASPGAFAPALFEPAIGYTLRPRQAIEAWGDSFTANEIGFRTGRPPRRRGRPGKGPFRVVFLGDSWTFGLGVREEEAFPAQVAGLAARLKAAGGRPVRTLNLGLPGYNTLNEIAVLDFFYDRLHPDAVVICPTANDAESSANVLPNGSLTHMGIERDGFGADHLMVFPRLVDSHLFRSRWRRSFAEIRRMEERLRARGVPLLVFFAATWDEPFAHALVRDAGLSSPYVITPRRFASPRWRSPAPWSHGTPAANRLYAHMVYRGLVSLLGWPPPPPADVKGADVAVHRRPPTGTFEEPLRELLARESRKIPERYRPGSYERLQCVGPMDCASGLAGKATTILVRRRAGASRIAVELRPLPDAPSLTPLPVRVSIPSPGGGTEARATLRTANPLTIQVPIPDDLPPDAVLDVTIRAARAVSSPAALAPRSLYVAAIEQNSGR
jgi:hypothetical protein